MLGNGLDQVLDADLECTAEVHRIAAVVPLHRQDDPVRRILDLQELARRRAVARHLDGLLVAPVSGLQALPDKRRDDVGAFGVEVVARRRGSPAV